MLVQLIHKPTMGHGLLMSQEEDLEEEYSWNELELEGVEWRVIDLARP